MESKAIAKTVRIAPRKVRLVLDLVRGKKVGEALGILEFTTKSASLPVAKVIKSAAANAEHNYGMNVEDLVAVSYTHLDVYKRQERGLLMDVTFEKNNGKTIIKTVKAHPTLVYSKPVSYTHLDVYKRQI